jgi:hypothetical protein
MLEQVAFALTRDVSKRFHTLQAGYLVTADQAHYYLTVATTKAPVCNFLLVPTELICFQHGCELRRIQLSDPTMMNQFHGFVHMCVSVSRP